MWKEFYCISVDNCPCFRQVYVVASVVVFSSIHIPAISSSGFPTLADSRLDVYNNLDAWRGNRSGVLVKVDIKFCLGLEVRTNSQWSKNIQGEYCLWKESTPQLQRKIVVCGYQTCNKIVLTSGWIVLRHFGGADVVARFGNPQTFSACNDLSVGNIHY